MENTKENPMNISLPGLVNVYELERSTMLLGKSKRTFEAMASSSLKLLVTIVALSGKSLRCQHGGALLFFSFRLHLCCLDGIRMDPQAPRFELNKSELGGER